MTISDLTAPPDLPDKTEQDQTTFDSRMSAWWEWMKDDLEPELNTITDEIDAVADSIDSDTTAAQAAKTAAEAAQTAAEAAEDGAVTASNATIWTAGTPYDAGDIVLDPGDNYYFYTSQQGSNTGNIPNTDDGTYWMKSYTIVETLKTSFIL